MLQATTVNYITGQFRACIVSTKPGDPPARIQAIYAPEARQRERKPFWGLARHILRYAFIYVTK